MHLWKMQRRKVKLWKADRDERKIFTVIPYIGIQLQNL